MFTYKRNMNVFFVMIDFIIFLLYYINYIYHVSPLPVFSNEVLSSFFYSVLLYQYWEKYRWRHAISSFMWLPL